MSEKKNASSDESWIKSPDGRFAGSRPGYGKQGGLVSEETYGEINALKGGFLEWSHRLKGVEFSAADMKETAAAQATAEKLHAGDITMGEAMSNLAQERPTYPYRKAVEILDNDPSYWSDLSSRIGFNNVDTLLTRWAGQGVNGATAFVNKLAQLGVSVADAAEIKPGGPGTAESGVKSASTVRGFKDKDGKDVKVQPYSVFKNADEKEAWKAKLYHNATVAENESKYAIDRDPNAHEIMTAVSGNSFEGYATMYNSGETTANGEPFDKDAKTAAINALLIDKLPQGKSYYAKVTLINPDLTDGKSIPVRLNDHGPYQNFKKPPVSQKSAQTEANTAANSNLVPFETQIPHPNRIIDLTSANMKELTGKERNDVSVRVDLYEEVKDTTGR
jgi:stage V sporulation protein SpoVS